MRKIILVAFAFLLVSCTKDSRPQPTVFDILGKWGSASIIFIHPDGPSSVFNEIKDNYYSYWTFQVTGTMIEESASNGNKKYGTYVYNENIKKLTYLFDGNTRPVEAWITVHSPVSMTVTVDYKEVGQVIHTMRKLDW